MIRPKWKALYLAVLDTISAAPSSVVVFRAPAVGGLLTALYPGLRSGRSDAPEPEPAGASEEDA